MPAPFGLRATDARALDEFVQAVRSTLGHQVVSLKLFGSKATGTDVPGSDIDVLVVVSDWTVKLEDAIIDIAFVVNLEHDVYISPRVIDHSLLEHSVWRITPFARALETTGIAL
jgi:predicted nucleotidyltransferase